MQLKKVFSFAELATADLHVDAVYQGGRRGNSADDPFSRLLSVSNQGGFRYRGSIASLEMIVLTSTLSDPDWPDGLDSSLACRVLYGPAGDDAHEQLCFAQHAAQCLWFLCRLRPG